MLITWIMSYTEHSDNLSADIWILSAPWKHPIASAYTSKIKRHNCIHCFCEKMTEAATCNNKWMWQACDILKCVSLCVFACETNYCCYRYGGSLCTCLFARVPKPPSKPPSARPLQAENQVIICWCAAVRQPRRLDHHVSARDELTLKYDRQLMSLKLQQCVCVCVCEFEWIKRKVRLRACVCTAYTH